MTDAPVDRFAAELRQLRAALLNDPDPLTRYQALTAHQRELQQLVSEVKRHRGDALAELAEGRSYQQVADLIGIGNRQRVSQLINNARRSMGVTR